MTALDLKLVTKRYKGFTLEDVCMELPKGCIMGLIGENGAGKSTTMKLILGINQPDSGEIKVLGQSHMERLKGVKEDIGVVFDEPCFPNSFTAKNLERMMNKVYKNWDPESFWHYLSIFSLPLDKRFKDFSRGMKMKISIAVALSHNAKLLILDEPTGGLDPIARDQFVDIIYDYTRNEENTVLISSHIVSDLEKLCDYITFIHQGRVLFSEEKDVLLEKHALWKGSRTDFSALAKKAVLGCRQSPYGIEALVNREMVPPGLPLEPAGIEDIIVFLAKEER